MRHIVSDLNDIPALPPVMDRRKTPDRRKVWRGGRRASDWENRPVGALDRLELARRQGAWRRALFSVLHLW